LVLVGRDRVALARLAHESLGAKVAILDDGLQHRRLARDLEIIVVDMGAPFGNGHTFPRGPLREPLSALGRADLLWLTRADEAPMGSSRAAAALNDALRRLDRPVIRSRFRIDALRDLAGEKRHEAAWLRGRKVFALSGVARPKSFLNTLTQAGARVVGHESYGDHHAFSEAELEALGRRVLKEDATLVTTEKDAARLPAELNYECLSLSVSLEILEGEAALDQALRALAVPSLQ